MMKKHKKSKILNKKFEYSDEFVDFKKVLFQLNDIEDSIDNWKALLNKENIKQEFFKLIKEDINNLELVSLLLATRWNKFRINIEFGLNKKENISDEVLEKIYLELKKTQIFEIIKSKKVSNLKDYLLGVLVGMDTNARKNRNGKRFEETIKKLLEEKGLNFKEQVSFKNLDISNEVKEKLSKEVKKRKIDFVVFLKNKTLLIEVNTFNGGGSKIYKTSTDFQTFGNIINKYLFNFEFIWVSGGKFWNKETATKRRNKELLKYFFNLEEFKKWISKL